jgi:hypothetical protein
MKKFFTLLVSSLFSLSLLAYDGSRISISTINNNMNLKIELDGERVRLLGNSITLNNVNEGNHNVRVYRAKRKYYNDFRNETDFEIIYASSVFLNRSYQMDITINGVGKVFMDSYRIENDEEYYHGNISDNADKDNGHGCAVNNGYSNIMNAGEFSQLMGQIQKERFDANRMISVKTITDKNNFTAKQIKEMMYLFTFESNRLEVAKYAYRKTLDKENYWQLNDVLTFSSSKDELARFIRESR